MSESSGHTTHRPIAVLERRVS